MRFQRVMPMLGGLGLASVSVMPAWALQVFVGQDASYSYIDATNATNEGTPASNWFAPGFNDGTWFTGHGPFSSNPVGDTIMNGANVNAPFGPGATQPVPTGFTQWDIFHDPYLRTHFTLTAPTALTIWIAVDNGIGVVSLGTGMYINGIEATGSVNAEGPAIRWESVFNIAADDTVPGDNVFAVQLEDHGVVTGFDMMITAENGDNPPFTTNPPVGVPEPATFALFGFGLAGLRLIGRGKVA